MKRTAPAKSAKRTSSKGAAKLTRPAAKRKPAVKPPAKKAAVKTAPVRKAAAKKAVAKKAVPKKRTAKTPAAKRVAVQAAPRKPAALKPRREPVAAPAPTLPDPTLELYESGLRAMFRQRWSEAAKYFRRVVETRDGAEADVQERALQQLRVCEDKLAGEDSEAGDPFLLAVVRKNAGDYEEALALCTRGGRQSKDERFAYLAASIHALRGEGKEAGHFLELAIGLNPKNRVHAFHDSDFQALREQGVFDALLR